MTDRWARLTSRTFRWAPPDRTTGYFAAEVEGERVRWLEWSHVHGEGCRPLGVQSLEDLRASGPPLPVPAPVLAEVLCAMERSPGVERGNKEPAT